MKVVLSDYNPDWVNIFEREKENLKKALGNKAVRIEHIGSTSVNGLGAKPVIDILLGVYRLTDADEFIPKMQQLGFEYITKYEDTVPERRYFVKRETANTLKIHVHSFELANEHWCRHLLFRDYLRVHDEVRDAYYQTKKELAQKEWNEANDYADAKTGSIRKIDADALKEFTFKTEKAECDGTYELYLNADSESKKLCGVKTKKLGIAVLIQIEIFPDFSNSRVTGLGLEKPIDQNTIDKIKHFFRESKSRHTLQLVPSVVTEEVKNLLSANEYEHKNNWAIFYRDVSPIENVRTDFEIKHIGKNYADAFAELVTRNYSFPAEMNKIFSSPIPQKNINYYLAFNKDQPVGAGCVYFGGDTAWVGLAVTQESYRGRGAQAAMLKARIDDAREKGCRWISVRTAEEHNAPSFRNMLRYGFRLLYKRHNYVFEPN
jgi:GrpB-like predicted nucleotidyltransferase (UPF0157 family)/GNAT superfamily N-acetyltransferase